jgi:acyl-CoA reductase-like NAD-dependent aldehyde dehydrogenase
MVAEATAAGVDKVFLTGSEETGRAVLATLAPHGIPAVMELSGHDAVFVCDGADLGLVARCVAYGVTFNGGATCIAPRRVFVTRAMAAELEPRLAKALGEGAPAVSIIAVETIDEALALSNQCPYRLGASVFGPPNVAAAVAARVDAGCVVVNDMIAPTADPRLPFGGRGRSGFGLTRGAEGLLEMTRVKAVATRIGSFRPHLEPPHAGDEALFAAYLSAAHGGRIAARVRGVVNVVSNLLRRKKS